MHPSETKCHSVCHTAESRSSSCSSPSSAAPASARMVRATAITCSDQVGFRFWGIVLLPTCPTPNFSSKLAHFSPLHQHDLVGHLGQAAQQSSKAP